MSFLNICAWATGDLSESGGSGAVSVQSAIKRAGEAYALRVNPAGAGTGLVSFGEVNPLSGFGQKNFDKPTIYFTFYLLPALIPDSLNEPFFDVSETTTFSKCEGRLNSDGKVVFYARSTTLVATGTTVLDLNTRYRIDVMIGTGVNAPYEILINGVVELSGTFSTPTSNNNNTGVGLGKTANRNGKSVDLYYSSFALSDSAYPGAQSTVCVRVAADGHYLNATIGAGSGELWEQVDEIPPDGDTTHLISSGVTDERYTARISSPSAAGVLDAINTVKPIMVQQVIFSGGLTPCARNGSTDIDANYQTNGQGYNKAEGLMLDTDPATGLAWTLAGLATLEVGFKEKTSAEHPTKVTHLSAMVNFVTDDSESGIGDGGQPPCQFCIDAGHDDHFPADHEGGVGPCTIIPEDPDEFLDNCPRYVPSDGGRYPDNNALSVIPTDGIVRPRTGGNRIIYRYRDQEPAAPNLPIKVEAFYPSFQIELVDPGYKYLWGGEDESYDGGSARSPVYGVLYHAHGWDGTVGRKKVYKKSTNFLLDRGVPQATVDAFRAYSDSYLITDEDNLGQLGRDIDAAMTERLAAFRACGPGSWQSRAADSFDPHNLTIQFHGIPFEASGVWVAGATFGDQNLIHCCVVHVNNYVNGGNPSASILSVTAPAILNWEIGNYIAWKGGYIPSKFAGYNPDRDDIGSRNPCGFSLH